MCLTYMRELCSLIRTLLPPPHNHPNAHNPWILWILYIYLYAQNTLLLEGSSDLGPVVQSIVSLTSSLVVKMLTVLVSTLYKSQVFCWKMWVAFANAKATHIFSAKILAYAIFNYQSFNDMLTNSIVSFEQLSPGHLSFIYEPFREKCLGVRQFSLCISRYVNYSACLPLSAFFSIHKIQ